MFTDWKRRGRIVWVAFSPFLKSVKICVICGLFPFWIAKEKFVPLDLRLPACDHQRRGEPLVRPQIVQGPVPDVLASRDRE